MWLVHSFSMFCDLSMCTLSDGAYHQVQVGDQEQWQSILGGLFDTSVSREGIPQWYWEFYLAAHSFWKAHYPLCRVT